MYFSKISHLNRKVVPPSLTHVDREENYDKLRWGNGFLINKGINYKLGMKLGKKLLNKEFNGFTKK